MKLRDLLSVLPSRTKKRGPIPQGDATVTDLTDDSRRVNSGSVFVAIRGTKYDAHADLAKVAALSPLALIVEDASLVPPSFAGAVIEVESSRRALAHLASRFNGDPSLHLFCFGVTGTNGKTSCTYLVEHLLNAMGLPTGVIGTVEQRLGTQRWSTENTTPGALALQTRLAEMRAAGARALAMEVSSHALDQFRADGIHFNAVLFTNLTRDHLDYHGTMEKYFASKQRLFTELLWESRKSPLVAAVNGDDEWGRRLRVASPADVLTFGEQEHNDFRYEILKSDFSGTRVRLTTAFDQLESELPLVGRHSVANAMGAVASVLALGMAPATSLRALENFAGVPGRLQPVKNNRGIHVFVDYAHSPDALENVLRALGRVRSENQLGGEIRVVFGCGGDRDRGKRPQMARIAEAGSDDIIVTNDNPRTEDPQAILNEIATGFSNSKPHRLIADRREAIAAAVKASRPGDVVLIAGKGHEDYQIIGDQKLHFSDVETAREVLA